MRLTVDIPESLIPKLVEAARAQSALEKSYPSAEKYPGLEGVIIKTLFLHLGHDVAPRRSDQS